MDTLDMGLTEYQEGALRTMKVNDTLDWPAKRVTYLALKLVGEAGEVAEKVGKLMRPAEHQYAFLEGVEGQREALAKELGDVLWYVAVLAAFLGYDLAEIGRMNQAKLASRDERGVTFGDGDDR